MKRDDCFLALYSFDEKVLNESISDEIFQITRIVLFNS